MSKAAIEGVKRLNAFAMNPNDLVIVGLDTGDGNEHPLFDERAFMPLEEAMVLNIMVYGVIETVTARKDGAVPCVVDGRRRVLHAREANKRLEAMGEEPILVPVMLIKGDTERAEGISVSLNEHRKDDEILLKADKAMRMLSRNGDDFSKAAVAFGVTVATIRNWVKLAGLSPKVKDAVRSGALGATAATKLAGLSEADAEAEMENLIASGEKVTVEKATRARAERTGEKVVRGPSKKVLKRIAADGGAYGLSEDFLLAIKLVLGEVDIADIAGVADLLGKDSNDSAESTESTEGENAAA